MLRCVVLRCVMRVHGTVEGCALGAQALLERSRVVIIATAITSLNALCRTGAGVLWSGKAKHQRLLLCGALSSRASFLFAHFKRPCFGNLFHSASLAWNPRGSCKRIFLATMAAVTLAAAALTALAAAFTAAALAAAALAAFLNVLLLLLRRSHSDCC